VLHYIIQARQAQTGNKQAVNSFLSLTGEFNPFTYF
jgi:hypothetical protein